jgi:MFS family permease
LRKAARGSRLAAHSKGERQLQRFAASHHPGRAPRAASREPEGRREGAEGTGRRALDGGGFPPSSADPGRAADDDVPYVPQNIRAWVGYQLFLRIGWQFKMESTMVAGLVSYLSGSGAVMGLFTTVNTLCRTVAPLLAVSWVDARPRKRDALLVFWLLTTLCWAAAAAFLWTPAAQNRSLALLWLLVTYTLFMTFMGCTSVAQGTLLGKIIPVLMRGRAMSLAHTIAGPLNVVAIFVVYRLVDAGWFPAPRNYAFAFSLTVFFFLMAALALLGTREAPSRPARERRGLGANTRYLGRLLTTDPNLRLLVLIHLSSALDGNILGLYTTYGRLSGALNDRTVVLATVCQVLFQTISTSILGRVADQRGNRVVICGLLWVQAVNPLVALLCAGLPLFHATRAYLAVYALIGLRFPIFQLLTNYLLEVTPRDEHAQALGAMSTLMILTAPVPLLLGLLADWSGYGLVMSLTAAAMLAGASVAPRLREPREG